MRFAQRCTDINMDIHGHTLICVHYTCTRTTHARAQHNTTQHNTTHKPPVWSSHECGGLYVSAPGRIRPSPLSGGLLAWGSAWWEALAALTGICQSTSKQSSARSGCFYVTALASVTHGLLTIWLWRGFFPKRCRRKIIVLKKKKCLLWHDNTKD